ncbi:unnamed protein product, partial [marine sediment metagenome]
GNLNTAVFDAVKKLKVTRDIYFISSCFGFAGNDAGEDSKTYRKIVFNDKLNSYLNPKGTIICNDTRIGLESGSESKNKIIIIAGAGSNCFGINEDGKQAGASGWDFILADEGSGYSVGLKALKAIVKAYDGRGEKTLLSKTILEELNLNEIPDLIKWAYGRLFPKDKKVEELVNNFDPEKLMLEFLRNNAEMCGGGPVISAMIASKIMGANSSKILNYKNSGDVTGDRSAVVGYLSAAFYKK